ncbi:hypothetical protein DEU56DRAFT_831188 [Suillus clintonianus]|uniref:uncharacterized protein n=1 Tax=Suillus clintonianus TaxID=1904413 RepID=UPI001B87F0C1|nr:uncharacterized protein DEU56DRAFT_831188 [Suillus clintonianus]KAG2122941.1 hypothetical protein DEU56DRAFT_831188 [Suillus clintonianus]
MHRQFHLHLVVLLQVECKIGFLQSISLHLRTNPHSTQYKHVCHNSNIHGPHSVLPHFCSTVPNHALICLLHEANYLQGYNPSQRKFPHPAHIHRPYLKDDIPPRFPHMLSDVTGKADENSRPK